jgi:hypothetical protein
VVDAAEVYVEAGFRIVALWGLTPAGACQCPKGVNCGKAAGKHPVMRGWQDRAPVDVLAHLRRYPDRNLGLVMGGSRRFVALDVDGEGGAAQLAAFEAEHGQLPPTVVQRTGSGGEHRLFFCPDHLDVGRLGNRVRVAGGTGGAHAGLDVRAEGGLIVVAPSTHRSGRPYQWTAGGEVAALPDALFNLLAAPVLPPPAPLPLPTVSAGSSSFGPHARRPDVVSRARSYVARLEPAVEGAGGHKALLSAAWHLTHGFDLSDAEAEAVLWADFNPRCSPPWPPGHEDIAHKVRQSRRLKRCQSKPRGFLLDVEGERRYRSVSAQPASAPDPTGPSSSAVAHEEEPAGSVEESPVVAAWLQARGVDPDGVDLFRLAKVRGSALVFPVVGIDGEPTGEQSILDTRHEEEDEPVGLLACDVGCLLLRGYVLKEGLPGVTAPWWTYGRHPLNVVLCSTFVDYLRLAAAEDCGCSITPRAHICLGGGWPEGLAGKLPRGCIVDATRLAPDHLDAALDDLLDLAAAGHLTLTLPETP